MQLDQSQDFRVWDNTETLTYVSTQQAGDQVDAVRHVRRHLVGVKEAAASAGAYTAGDVLFYVPRVALRLELGEPKPGDVLLDDEQVRWTVLGVDKRKRDRRAPQTYKLQARDLRLAFQLEDLVTIETPARSLDATGARVVAWVPKYELLPAKVQQLAEAESEERGLRGSKVTYSVTVDRQIKVTLGEDRIVWRKGLLASAGATAVPDDSDPPVHLDITGYRNPERLDELPVMDAEVRP